MNFGSCTKGKKGKSGKVREAAVDAMSEETVEAQRSGELRRGESPVEIQGESDRARQAGETVRTEKPTAEATEEAGRIEKPTAEATEEPGRIEKLIAEATGESDGVRRLTAEAALTERAAV